MSFSATYTRGSYNTKPRTTPGLRLIDIMLAIMALEFLAGSIIIARELIEARKIREQIVQISKFDASVATFHSKYDGLPGDLLSAQADRMGLPTGNGTPAHSDGDGKISPCSPGWQDALGCENIIFWAQLAASELLPGSFTGSSRFLDSRIEATEQLQFYLPQSPIYEDVYFTVWNSDHIQLPPRGKYIPDGNYYELTALLGVENNKIIDEPYAISPLMAKEIDSKIDDGYALRGRIIVNGEGELPEYGWSAYAQPDVLECVAPNEMYNTKNYFKAHRRLCHLAIAIECCGTEN